MFLAEQFCALIFTPTLFFYFFSSLSSSSGTLWHNGDHLAHNGHNPTTYGTHQRSVIPWSHALLLFRFRVKRERTENWEKPCVEWGCESWLIAWVSSLMHESWQLWTRIVHQTTPSPSDQSVFLFIQISTIDSPDSEVGKQTMPCCCNKAFLSNCLLHQLNRPYWGMTLASCNTHKALNWSPLATSVNLSGPEDTQVSHDISFFFWTSSSLLKRVIHIQSTVV